MYKCDAVNDTTNENTHNKSNRFEEIILLSHKLLTTTNGIPLEWPTKIEIGHELRWWRYFGGEHVDSAVLHDV